MNNLIKRLAKWSYGQHPAVSLAVQFALFPGILFLSLLLPYKHGSDYSVGWTIAYAVINAVGLTAVLMLQRATQVLECEDRKSTTGRLVEAYRSAAEAKADFLMKVIEARQRVESLPPEQRAQLLAKLDAAIADEKADKS